MQQVAAIDPMCLEAQSALRIDDPQMRDVVSLQVDEHQSQQPDKKLIKTNTESER